MATFVDSSTLATRRRRRLNGLPRAQAVDAERRWLLRVINNGQLWLFAISVGLAVTSLVGTFVIQFGSASLDQNKHFSTVLASRFIRDLQMMAWKALPTLLVYLLVFILFDRWRTQGAAMWSFALAWGGGVAILTSLVVNSTLMSVFGELWGAVFCAPFVEEFFKISGIIVLITAMRYRMTPAGVVVLSGISAVGFAFSENITYYFRTWRAAQADITSASPEAELDRIVFLRGVLTSWGHPSFTMMTGLGLALAIRSRSKTVRIVAPVAGYLTAALMHTYFNSSSVVGKIDSEAMLLLQFGLPGFFIIVGWLFTGVVRWLKEGRLIRARLTDYARTGWAEPTDPDTFGKLGTRMRLIWLGMFAGPRPLLATCQLIHAMTELALLRDAMTRGTIDCTGLLRERELFDEIRLLRAVACTDPRARRRPLLRGRNRSSIPGFPAPTPVILGHPPQTLGSSVTSSSAGSAPQSSPVNPNWAPPPG